MTDHQPRRDRICLSLDGGGARGAASALLLEELEGAIGHVYESVDLIAGSSTGAILACALAAGIPAHTIRDLYTERGPAIFARSWWWRARTAGGVLGPKYNVSRLAQELHTELGTRRMADALCPLLVTSYDLERGKPRMWKSHHADDQPALMADVALASAAAPTYFRPHRIWGGYYIDGGVVANDPALCAWAEARTLWPGDPITVISIGTGRGEKGWDGGEAQSWGLKSWARPIASILMDGPQEATGYIMERTGARYLRVDPDLSGLAMDDASPEAFRRIALAAARCVRSPEWRAVAEVLHPRLQVA
jgi:uncharacterized protein